MNLSCSVIEFVCATSFLTLLRELFVHLRDKYLIDVCTSEKGAPNRSALRLEDVFEIVVWNRVFQHSSVLRAFSLDHVETLVFCHVRY